MLKNKEGHMEDKIFEIYLIILKWQEIIEQRDKNNTGILQSDRYVLAKNIIKKFDKI